MKTYEAVSGWRAEDGGGKREVRGTGLEVGRWFRLLAGGWVVLLLCALAPLPGSASLTLKTLVTFYGTNGAQPYAGLILGTNGSFYGTTSAGGAYNQGAVFTVTPSGMTNMVSFDGTNGAKPMGGLIQGLDGNFYGTTSAGGDYSNGTVFAMSPSGQLALLGSFDGTNGAQPQCVLTQNPFDGNLYGTTPAGGEWGFGAAFSLTPPVFPESPAGPDSASPLRLSTAITLLSSFDNTNTGAYPSGGLIVGYDGNLYGTTSAGGSAFDSGTFYMVVPSSGALLPLLSFSETNGAASRAPLFVSTNVTSSAFSYYASVPLATANGYGYLYGTSAGGGTDQVGTIFGLTATGADTNMLSFSFAITNGAVPFDGLSQGADGLYYGTTSAGGGSGSGAVFSFDPSNSAPIKLVYSFSGGSGGGSPEGGVVQGPDGNFYGTTLTGGKGKKGTVFQLTGFVPYIITQPTNQAGQTSNTITLAVLAGGSAPLKYQWLYNSNYVGNSHRISGAKTPILTISNAQPDESGAYSVFIQNDYGSITSTNIALTIVNPYGQQRPIVRITGPAQNKYLSSAAITVTGTTSTTVTVAQVSFRLNGGGWQTASPVHGWKSWSADVTLSPGTNVFQAYAVNIVGVRSLTNTAFFVPSPFAQVAGAYNGLFYDPNNVTVTNAGFFTLETTYLGKFSGSLQMAGAHYSFGGLFDTNGSGQATIPMGKLEPLNVWLQLDMTQGTGHITGSVSNQTWVADLAGDLDVFNGVTSIPLQQGLYTLVIPGAGAAPQPAGESWGTVMVDAAGKIHLSGSLADGTSLAQTVPVSPTGRWPLYESLYSGQGLLLGWLAFPNGSNNEGPAGEVLWLKSPLSKGAYYTNGITLRTAIQSSPYAAPAAWPGLFNTTNLVLTLGGGGLAPGITNRFTLGPKNQVVNLSSNKLSLSFSLSAGSFKGSVVNPATSKSMSFTGVVLQNQGAASGFFPGSGQSGDVLIAPEAP